MAGGEEKNAYYCSHSRSPQPQTPDNPDTIGESHEDGMADSSVEYAMLRPRDGKGEVSLPGLI